MAARCVFFTYLLFKKTGIKELLENIKLLAEVAELRANPERSGTGLVIEAKLEDLKTAHKSQDIAQIDTAVNALNEAWTAASEDMYKATQDGAGTQPGAQPEGNNSQGSENVTDAEFEEVK